MGAAQAYCTTNAATSARWQGCVRKDFPRQLTALEQESRRISAPEGIQPHLVFRLPLAPKASPEGLTKHLEDAGLQVVSIEPDRAIVAFRDDQNLTAFHEAIKRYEAGPRSGINPTTKEPYKGTALDVFEYVEAAQMRIWSRADRIGAALGEVIGRDGGQIEKAKRYVIEVELWHRGTDALSKAAVAEVETLIKAAKKQDERLLDSFVGAYTCLAKVAVSGATLSQLLDLPIVAEADLPPVPVFDAVQAARATPRSFPKPPRPDLNGPRVCILDSGITAGHPLLRANVGHEEAVLTTATSPADEHGHGTRVAGVAVFGSVRASYEAGSFASPILLFSGRVLNEHNHFDDEKLIVNQMRDAIRIFTKAPHHCRVFNLSLGSRAASLGRKQSSWAEALDLLARDEGVVLVVSTGNNLEVFTGDVREAERVLKRHPDQLLNDNARLSDPATAALAVTVGALAEHDLVAVRHSTSAGDLVRPVAKRDEPAPFTRVGPGIGNGVKPEFVDFGGNLVWNGTGSGRRVIRDDQGVAVMSLAREHTRQLFAYDVGTSYAAPRVARTAALLWHRLRADLGSDPHPNLVRVVLATAATIPVASRDLVESKLGAEAVLRVCGYGQVDDDLALESSDRRVTLVAQDKLALDHFRIYEVPIPAELKGAAGEKVISAALAFDPPVRRRRQDYLGTQMDFMLIRGKTPAQISAAYKKAGPDADMEGAFQQPYRVPMKPPPTKGPSKGTLQKGTFRFKREGKDYGDSYWLVVRAVRRWAPAEVEDQDFAVAVTLEADAPELYARVRARLRARVRVRT